MEISMEVKLFHRFPCKVFYFHGRAMEVSMEVGGTVHGRRSNGSLWTLMEFLWRSWKFVILVKVGGSCRGIWKLIDDSAECSWKLLLMEAMKAFTFTESGNFHVFPWKLLVTWMEVIYLHTLPSKSMEVVCFHRLPWKFPSNAFASMEVDVLIETSMEVIYFHTLPSKSMEVIYFHRLPWKFLFECVCCHGSRHASIETSIEVSGNFYGNK